MSAHRTARAHHRNRTAQPSAQSGHSAQRIMVGLLVAIAFAVVLLAVCVRPAMPTPAEWATVSVDANGSLWELASSHPIPGLSTAETIELIQRENSLASATIYAGQTIRVPAVTRAEGASFAQR